MATFESTRPAPFGAITAYRFVQVFGIVGERLAGWNNARMTRNALSKLSDRELDDVGLNRGDVERIARGGRF